MLKMVSQDLQYPPSREELIDQMYYHSYPFFLESLMENPSFGRYSYYGSDPFLVLKSKGMRITVIKSNKVIHKTGNPFSELKEILKTYRLESAPLGEETAPFIGGGVGYMGYDLCHFVEKLPNTAKDDLGFPDMFFAFYNQLIVHDHLKNKMTLVRLVAADNSISKPICMSMTGRRFRIKETMPTKFVSNFSRADYLRAVKEAKEYIAAGDIYQVNLSQRFKTDFYGSPLHLYKKLSKINPAPFSAFLRPNPWQIVMSSSPERFLKVKDGVVETRPIKGTRPRGKTKSEDNKLKKALLESEKDNAELAMIVDLERNDLGRVCKYGSVKVTNARELESYQTVHHLVATVKGELSPDKDVVDLIKASFPGGSITGAPKIRAMEIIDELEPTARGPYTGALGWIGFDGTMDLSIAIRILLVDTPLNQTINKVYYQVGGGIVADSVPEAEYKETLDKGRALERALIESQNS
ncbi:MAG: aminodeoxychorismate synthase component I [Planctomycetes bacterium]|nr:aminodeoxychorismate synthase component I [Planctomycetota bacterium]